MFGDNPKNFSSIGPWTGPIFCPEKRFYFRFFAKNGLLEYASLHYHYNSCLIRNVVFQTFYNEIVSEKGKIYQKCIFRRYLKLFFSLNPYPCSGHCAFVCIHAFSAYLGPKRSKIAKSAKLQLY